MKKKLLALGLGLLVLVLSGCMDIESKYYIYPDGSGKNTATFSMDPSKMVGMVGSFMGGMMPGGMPEAAKGTQNPLEELEKQGVTGISEINTTFTLYFNDLHKFKSGIKELIWEKKDNLYHLRIVPDLSKFQEKFAPELPEGAPKEQKQAADMGMMMAMEMMKGVKVSFVVMMPGEIVKSNSTQFKGREARWEMTIDELMKKKELIIEAFSKPPSPEAESEFKKFKEELARANKKLKEAMSSFQQLFPTE